MGRNSEGIDMSEWISVDKGSPEYDVYCLLIDDGRMHIGYKRPSKFSFVYKRSDGQLLHEVTHWMPLPEPPK